MAYCYYCMHEVHESHGACPRCGRKLSESQDKRNVTSLRAGTTIGDGRVMIGKQIGDGGFGITYIALQRREKGDRRVALKEFFPHHIATRGADGMMVEVMAGCEQRYEKQLRAFEREARMLNALAKHPNIVSVYFLLKDENNTAYYGMEFMEGKNLLEVMEEKGKPYTMEEALALLKPIFEALSYCHSQNIWHRDIKPQNIFMETQGGEPVAKLIDFGAAYAARNDFTQSVQNVRTNGYAPIEQCSASETLKEGPWTDVYALSATIYHMITGRCPPPSDLGTIKPPSDYGVHLAPPIEAALMHGLARRPENRIQDIDTLWKQLSAVSGSSTGSKKASYHEFDPQDSSSTEQHVRHQSTVVPSKKTGFFARMRNRWKRKSRLPETGLPETGMVSMQIRCIHGHLSGKFERTVHNGDVLGRGKDQATILLPDTEDGVSREHCRFFEKGGSWMIIDQSKNGTLLNGERLVANRPTAIRHGDILVIGSNTFKVIQR